MLKKPASGVLARHCRLTISAAFTSLPRFIQRGVNLRDSTYHRARAASAAQGGWVRKVTPRHLRHWALTDWRPSADVTLIILRVADLAAALLDDLFERRVGRTILGIPVGCCCAAAMLLLQACSSPPNVSSKVVVAPLPPPKTIGSLWQEENGRAYLYEDLRAMRIGDILTVKIVEQHKGSKSADTEAQRESTIKNSLIGSAMGYIGIPGIRFSDETRRGMGIDASANSKFNGKGSTNREGTLTGTISAIVTEVLPNGDLRIEGRREVTVNSEKQLMSLGGIVRRVDVDTKNTVLSSAVADARIEYSGLGVLDDVQRPGWFIRILDWVYPF